MGHYDGGILVLAVAVFFAVAAFAVGVVAVGQRSAGLTYLAGQRPGGRAVTARFDPVTGKVSALFGLGGDVSGSVIVAPDGREAAGWNTSHEQIATANLTTGRVSPAVRIGPAPYAAVFAPGDRRLYVAEAGSAAYLDQPGPFGAPGHTVTVIAVRSDRVEATIDVCSSPTALAVSAVEQLLIVACSKQVSLVDTRTDRVVGTINWPLGPDLVAVSPAGGEAVIVADADDNGGRGARGLRLLPIDLRTRQAEPPVTVAASTATRIVTAATALAFRPGDEYQVWVTADVSTRTTVEKLAVYRVDLPTRTVSAPLRLDGQLVAAVHFWPNGAAGYIAWRRLGARRCLVATSLAGPVHVWRTQPASPDFWWFTSSAPYVVVPHNAKEVTVVDIATGATRVWPLPFFPDELMTAT